MNKNSKLFVLIAFGVLFSVSAQAVSLQSNGGVHTVTQGEMKFVTGGGGLVDVYKNNLHLAQFGFTLKEIVNSNPQLLNSWETSWTWQILSNTDNNVTVLASTTWQGRDWVQTWYFSNTGQKFSHRLTNNTGFDIEGAQFFYVVRTDSVNVERLKYYDEQGFLRSFDFSQDFQTNSPQDYVKKIQFANILFNFQDLYDSGFSFDYLFAGQLNNAHASLPIANGFIVGVSKNAGLFPNGASVLLDPSIVVDIGGANGLPVFENGSPSIFRFNNVSLGVAAVTGSSAVGGVPFITKYYQSNDNGLTWTGADFNFLEAPSPNTSVAQVFNPDNNKVVLAYESESVGAGEIFLNQGTFDNLTNDLLTNNWDKDLSIGLCDTSFTCDAARWAMDINAGGYVTVCAADTDTTGIRCRYVDTDLNTADISNWSAIEDFNVLDGHNVANIGLFYDDSNNLFLYWNAAAGSPTVNHFLRVKYDVNGFWSNDLNMTEDASDTFNSNGSHLNETIDGNFVFATSNQSQDETNLMFCDDGAETCITSTANWNTYSDVLDGNSVFMPQVVTANNNDVWLFGTFCPSGLCSTGSAFGLNYRIFFDSNKLVSAPIFIDGNSTTDVSRSSATLSPDINGVIDLSYIWWQTPNAMLEYQNFSSPDFQAPDVNGIVANFDITVHTEDFNPTAIVNSLLVDFNSTTTLFNASILTYAWFVDSALISNDENVQRLFTTGFDHNISLIVDGTLDDTNAAISSQKDLNLNLKVPLITVADFNVNSQLSNLDINRIGNLNMRCTIEEVTADLNYIVELNDLNVFEQLVDDDFDMHLADLNFLDGENTAIFTCIADSGLSNSVTLTFDAFIKNFFFVFDHTGAVVLNSGEYVTADINSVFVYSFDNNLFLDLFADNQVSFNASGDQNTAIQIRIGYDDPTFPFTSRDFELKVLDVNSVPVCHSRLQTFYQNVFFSSIARQIRLINANTGCYHIAATTKFAFADSLSIAAFLVPQSYNLFLGENGVFSVLAVVDGSTAGQINIDALVIKRNSALEISIPSEAATIQKGCGELDDCNTFTIRYRNSKNNNSRAVATIFNGTLPQFSHTETENPNDFSVTFDATDLNFFDANVLKLTVVATRTDGSTKTFTIFFTPQGKVGFIDPAIAVILSLVIFIGGISLVSARIVFGWFGAIVTLIALAFLSFSVGVWWLPFMQAIMLAMLVYIGITFSQSQAGAT